jgi:hypothetical protein
MSKIPLRVKVEAEIMQAREESNYRNPYPASRSELVRIRRLEELVILLADVIDRLNQNRNE